LLLAQLKLRTVANECPIIEWKQASYVLTFRRQDLQEGRRARPACHTIEMAWLFAPSSFLILSEFLAA
jgi:hypothetical protein